MKKFVCTQAEKVIENGRELVRAKLVAEDGEERACEGLPGMYERGAEYQISDSAQKDHP